jgi:hypothetical protein
LVQTGIDYTFVELFVRGRVLRLDLERQRGRRGLDRVQGRARREGTVRLFDEENLRRWGVLRWVWRGLVVPAKRAIRRKFAYPAGKYGGQEGDPAIFREFDGAL